MKIPVSEGINDIYNISNTNTQRDHNKFAKSKPKRYFLPFPIGKEPTRHE
jgi:hypothetical protein